MITETKILSPLIVEDVNCAGEIWRVQPTFRIQSKTLNGVLEIADFQTDFASIPPAAQSIIEKNGPWDAGAVGHDFLYSNLGKVRVWQEWLQSWQEIEIERATADLFLLELMEHMGVSRWQRTCIYDAVRLFGGSHWKD